jgi:hypothetical protein
MYRGHYIKTQKLWFNSLPLCNFWMTEDFGFIFGGVMYEGAKVCRAKELARSDSPLCHQVAKTRKTKTVITPSLITGGISPNCYRTQDANFLSITHGCHYVAPSSYTRALTSWPLCILCDSAKFGSPSWISGSHSGVARPTELISDQRRHIAMIAWIAGWCDNLI